MSIAKLSRRVQRARIHNRNVALAQSIAARERPRVFAEGVARGRADLMAEKTDALAPIPGAYVLGDEPKLWKVLVQLQDRRHELDYEEAIAAVPHSARFVTCEPKRKAWRDSMGNVIVWYEWEVRP